MTQALQKSQDDLMRCQGSYKSLNELLDKKDNGLDKTDESRKNAESGGKITK